MLKERIWITFPLALLLFFPKIAYADLDALNPEGTKVVFILLTLLLMLWIVYKQLFKNKNNNNSKKYIKASIIFLICCLLIIICFNDEPEHSLMFALIILPILFIPSYLLAKLLAFFIITTIENEGENRIVKFLTTNKIVKYFYLFFLLLILVFGIYFSDGWIVYYEEPFRGKIIDTETKKPLAETVVVVIYKVENYSLIDLGSKEVDVQEVLTDENGEFYISSHTYYHYFPFARKKASEFVIFKSQYTVFPDWRYYRKYFPNTRILDSKTLSNYLKKGLTIELLHLKNSDEIKINALSVDIIDEFSSDKLPKLYEEISKDYRLRKM